MKIWGVLDYNENMGCLLIFAKGRKADYPLLTTPRRQHDKSPTAETPSSLRLRLPPRWIAPTQISYRYSFQPRSLHFSVKKKTLICWFRNSADFVPCSRISDLGSGRGQSNLKSRFLFEGWFSINFKVRREEDGEVPCGRKGGARGRLAEAKALDMAPWHLALCDSLFHLAPRGCPQHRF